MLAVVVALGTTVYGHMALESALPVAGSSITAPPASLQLTFTQAPDLAVSTLDLTGPSGAITLNNLHVMDNNVLMAMVGSEMPDGEYTVAWQSAGDDGHLQKGAYKFRLKRAAQ
jgi:methionine-rich copper-binding protein CopC